MSVSGSRTVFITGGARGLGKAMAAELSERGHQIHAPSRAELDLASPSALETWLARNGNLSVDILINNAGINILNPIDTVIGEAWQTMLQINLSSALRLIQAFAPKMQANGWGRILNVSTIFSLVTKERRAAYSMTKAALNALTRSAAVELGPRGVLVNSLAPGFIDTALTRQNNTPAALAAIMDTLPIRRMAQPEEIAKIAAFLVSEENTYMTGQTLVVDGGFTCL